jgi:hypothetical protein
MGYAAAVTSASRSIVLAFALVGPAALVACGRGGAGPPPAPVDAAPPAPPPGWSEYVSDRGFSISMPAARDEQRVLRDDVVVDMVLATPVDGVTYMALTSAAGNKGVDPHAALRDALAGMLDSMGGTVRARKRITVHGRPAAEYVVIDPSGSEIRGRIIMGNDRMFIVSSVAPSGLPRPLDEAFFESFRLR